MIPPIRLRAADTAGGGSISVTAAISEASFARNLLVIPLVLALIFVL